MRSEDDFEPVLKIAEEAGEAIMAFYDDPVDVERKADNSPLTQADLASHQLILQRLEALTPDIPALSEESKEIPFEERRGWRRFWLIDPVDGTKEFIRKTGQFTVNIALIEDGRPAFGVVRAPAIDLTYWAVAGRAYKQDRDGGRQAIAARAPDAARLGVVASRDHAGPMVQELIDRFPGAETKSMGSSLKFCLVAEGAADVYLRDVPTMEWDTGAAQAVVEAAGGSVTDLEGETLAYNKNNLRNPSLVALGRPDFGWR